MSYFLPEQNKWANSLCFQDWMNTLALNDKHSLILLCLYKADPANFSLWEQLVCSILVQNYTEKHFNMFSEVQRFQYNPLPHFLKARLWLCFHEDEEL